MNCWGRGAGLGPGTYADGSQTPVTPALGDLVPSSSAHRHLHLHMPIPTDTNKYRIKNKISLLKVSMQPITRQRAPDEVQGA